MRIPARLRPLALVASISLLVAALSTVPLEGVFSWGWDASVFRAGSRALLAGENPYDPASIRRFSDGAELATIPYFVYAPFFAILFVPFAILPPGMALRAWLLANLGMVLAASALTLNLPTGGGGRRSLLVGAAAVAFFPPLRTLLIVGQSSAVMFVVLVASVHLVKKARGLLGGMLLSLAFFKPHLALTPIFLGLRRLGRPLLGIAAGLVILSLPFAFWIDDWVMALVKTRTENLSYGCLPFASVQALLACLLPSPGASAWMRFAILALPVAATVLLCARAYSPTSAAFELQLAMVVALSLMVFDNVRVADLILLLYPVLLLLRVAGGFPRITRLVILGLILTAYAFPYAAQLWAHDAILGSLPVWYSVTSICVFAAVLVALIVVHRSAPTVEAAL